MLEKVNIIKEQVDVEEPLVDVCFYDGIIQINIQKECTFEEYVYSISLYKNADNTFEIPVRMLITEGSDFLTAKLQKQKILIVHQKFTYFVIMNDELIKISERKTIDSFIHETIIDVNKVSKQYSISKYIHDFHHSTKSCKFYEKNMVLLENFALNKKEALSLASELLNTLGEVHDIDDFVSLESIYDVCNLASKFYVPIINDNIITLSLTYANKEFDISQETFAFFHIILNETKEKIGVINFCYGDNGGFTYDGNVGYRIKKEFQNKGYATRALKLLRNLLKNNQFDGDKDLYIATLPENEYSKKVAIHNDGELIYYGEVPEDKQIEALTDVKEVFVYRIKI